MSPLPGQRTFDPPKPTPQDRTHARRIGVDPALYVKRRLEGLKWCSGGKHWLPPMQFNRSRREKDGRTTTCRECQRAYWQAYRRRKRPPKA